MKSAATLLCLVGFLHAPTANAGPYARVPLDRLVNSADGIVVAAMVQQADGSSSLQIPLEVKKVFKGDIAQGSIVYVAPPPELRTIPKGQARVQGVWFLKRIDAEWTAMPTSAGDIAFPDLLYQTEPADTVGLANTQANATALDRVILELSGSILSGKQLTLLEAMLGTRSAVARELYSTAARSANASVRGFGLAGLIRENDPSSISQLEQEATRQPALQNDASILVSVQELYRSPALTGIQALGRIALSKKHSDALRVGAANALMAIHSKDSVAFLATLLDDPSPEMRFRGLFGLASFANGFPIQTPQSIASMSYLTPEAPGWKYRSGETMRHVPSVDAFRADEPSYMKFWKDWWSRVRHEFAAP